MAIAFGAIGAKAAGTTTTALDYPTGVAAGHLALACRVGWQTVTFSDETGWTLGASLAGGVGSAQDNHPTAARVDVQTLTGSESGSVTFDHGGGAQAAIGCMLRYSIGAGETWDVTYATGDDGSHGANRIVAASSSLALAPGDIVVAVVALDSDGALSFESADITVPGITFGTTTRLTPATAGSTLGGDGNIEVFEAAVSSGTATDVPTFTMMTSSPSNCGPVVFVRLRAVASATDLTVAAAAQAQTAENVTLTQVHELTSAAATQAQTADSPTLTQVHNLTVQDATHGHTADSPTLTQAHGLSVAAATHAHTAENATLVAAGDLSVDDATHAHAADGPALTQAHALTVADAAQAQTADAATLTQAHSLTVADTDHAQSAEAAALTQTHVLTVEAATHEQTAGSPTLGVVSEGDGEPVERPRFSITDTTPELTITDTTARVTLDDTTGTLALTDTTARLTLDEATALVGV